MQCLCIFKTYYRGKKLLVKTTKSPWLEQFSDEINNFPESPDPRKGLYCIILVHWSCRELSIKSSPITSSKISYFLEEHMAEHYFFVSFALSSNASVCVCIKFVILDGVKRVSVNKVMLHNGWVPRIPSPMCLYLYLVVYLVFNYLLVSLYRELHFFVCYYDFRFFIIFNFYYLLTYLFFYLFVLDLLPSLFVLCFFLSFFALYFLLYLFALHLLFSLSVSRGS